MSDSIVNWSCGPSAPGARVVRIPVVSIADGTVTEYFPACVGYLHSIRYIKTDYADTVDFTITVEATGQGVWTEANVTAAAIKYPRLVPHNLVGVALAALTVAERIFLANERLKVVLAGAGDTKTGEFEAVFLPL